MIARIGFVGLLVLAMGHSAAADEWPSIDEVRAAVVRALPLLDRGAAGSMAKRPNCFTCHNQGLPLLALTTARARGFEVDGGHLARQGKFIAGFLERNREKFLAGKGTGGEVATAGQALWALETVEWKPDAVTSPVAEYLLLFQKDSDHWRMTSNRPPTESSHFTANYLAIRGLKAFGTPEQQERITPRIEQARGWLLKSSPQETEDRVFRLWGLHLAGASSEDVQGARNDLLATQRDDGGWAQKDGMDSDPYAAGTALVALHDAGGLETSDAAYQRGLRFLLKTQLDDGSWHVRSRSKPFQTYFESGFPHGADQFLSIAASSWAATALALASPKVEPTYDLVIRNGRIVDGTGNPWFRGDVAIQGGRIVAVGKLPAGATGRDLIDASGLIVAPGFIDMHSHSDFLLLDDGNGESKIRQGVTTEILGEGGSAGPYQGKLAPRPATIAGETVRWTRLSGYFDAVEKAGISPNVASYVGLDNVWQSVMGQSFARPTTSELDEMKRLVDEAMRDGALGLSSQVMMPPGSLATTDEIVELCRVVARHGGIYSSHIRNEGMGVFESVKEAIAIGERAGVPVDVIHLKIADQQLWGRMNEVVELIESARRRGADVQANVYPYTRGNNNLVSIIPPWAHEGGKDELLARLKDPEQRARMKKDIRDGIDGWYNHYTAVGGDWGRMLVSGENAYKGLTMDRVMAMRTQSRPDADRLDELFDLLIEERGSVSTVYAHHSEEDMNVALAQPWCSIGSDGSAYAVEGKLRIGNPHPRNFGTFPRVLGVYVREKGLLRLEDAVRKMTSLSAAKAGLRDRGLLRAGHCADLTLFDPEKVIDRATYTEPFQYGEGIEHVIVNGARVLDRGRHTGERPGKALRRSREESPPT